MCKAKMDENWKNGIYGAMRIFNNKYEFKHHNGKIISFDLKEELDEYLQEYHLMTCELSQSEYLEDLKNECELNSLENQAYEG